MTLLVLTTTALYVRFPDGTPEVRMLWLSELTMRGRMNMGLNCHRQNCGQ